MNKREKAQKGEKQESARRIRKTVKRKEISKEEK